MPDLQTTGLGETIYSIERRLGYDIGSTVATERIQVSVVDRCKVLRIHMTVQKPITVDTVLTLTNENESQIIDTFTLVETLVDFDTIVWTVNPDEKINHFATGDRLRIQTDGATDSCPVSTVVVTGRGGTSKGANDIVALGDNIVVHCQPLDIGSGTGFETYFNLVPPNGYLRRMVINQDGPVDIATEIQIKLVTSAGGGAVDQAVTLPSGGAPNTATIFDFPNSEIVDLRQSERLIFRIDSDNAATAPPFVLVSLAFDVT